MIDTISGGAVGRRSRFSAPASLSFVSFVYCAVGVPGFYISTFLMVKENNFQAAWTPPATTVLG
jgi:hypothetical protein